MKKRNRLTTKQKVDIIHAFTVDLVPMIEIAKQYGVTRQAIWKMLHKAGVDTPKASSLSVSCNTCGKPVVRHKARIRQQKWHFCSRECYFAFLQASPYLPNRHGQRIGRRKVSEHFALQAGHVVHHENGNCRDNRLSNLRVFATQGDHIRYHRGFDASPIWDGSTVSRPPLNP